MDAGALSSAHPVRIDGDGDLVTLQIDAPLTPDWFPLEAYVNVLTISDEKPHDRKLLHTAPGQKRTPYFHSYGVTKDFVVLPFTPMEVDNIFVFPRFRI